MNAATTTKAAKAATSKTAAKVSHAKAKAAAAELPNISSVKLVPLTLIDVRPQVRTVFDEDSLHELANDILARGLLQPVLLNPNGSRFILIAGERRMRACNLAGLSDIPALITKASESEALLMQLAENIQREDLELGDQVTTIRLLHDNLKSVQAVAETVKKSTAWVSKRLALSHPDLCHQARNLMVDGITEDVEILNILSHMNSISWTAANRLEQQLRAGTASRETARQALKDAKNPTPATPAADQAERERIEAERKANHERHQEENKARGIERKHGTGPIFIDAALAQLQNECSGNGDDDENATAYLNSLRDDQRAAILTHLQQLQTNAIAWLPREWARCLAPYDSDYSYLEQFAAVMAIKGQAIDNLYALVTVLEDANREAEA